MTDVGQDGDNVLLDDEDRLCFIDPIIGFKRPLQDVLGAPNEHDIVERLLTSLLNCPASLTHE